MDDKSSVQELVWLYRAHQAALPFAESLSGWLSTNSHRHRKRFDYCPFQCQLCDEQRVIDGWSDASTDARTPVQ